MKILIMVGKSPCCGGEKGKVHFLPIPLATSHRFPVRVFRPHHQPHFLRKVICDLAEELFDFTTHLDLTLGFAPDERPPVVLGQLSGLC
jgi:hypothetical protein